MIKERGLLNLCAVAFKVRNICPFLLTEISEFLAQPEPTSEPVAWMWTRNYEGGGYTNKVFEFLNDAEEYAKDSKTLKSPDIIRPLYTAPPTREPLSDGATADMWHANKKATHADSYWAGVEFAEKHHGIGGGE